MRDLLLLLLIINLPTYLIINHAKHVGLIIRRIKDLNILVHTTQPPYLGGNHIPGDHLNITII